MDLATPPSRYTSQSSKKRVFPGGSSSCMEADLVEIPPPVDWRTKPKSYKQKEVLFPEIIDVDMDEDSVVVMVNDEKVVPSCKGKGRTNKTDGTKDKYVIGGQSKDPSTGFNDFGSDFFHGDDKYYDDMISDEDCAFLQSHFDHLDIPTGIEAPIQLLMSSHFDRVPLSGSKSSSSNNIDASRFHTSGRSSHSSLPSEVKKKMSIPSRYAVSGTFATKVGETSFLTSFDGSPSESLQMKTNVTTNDFATPSSSSNNMDASGFHVSGRSSHPSLPSKVKKKISIPGRYAVSGTFATKVGETSFTTSFKGSPSESLQMKTNITTNDFATPKHVGPGDSLSWQKSPKSLRSHSSSRLNKKPHPIGAYSYKPYPPKDLTIGAPHTPTSFLQQASKYSSWTESPSSTFGYQNVGNVSGNTAGIGSSSVSSAEPFPVNKTAFWLKEALVETKGVTSTSSSKVIYGNPDEIIEKFRLFKKFDTVQDFSDHHYIKKNPSGGQQSRGWMKKIQDEWKILEKNLPDSIYVRVCESRMDLLRAVILGAEGTPYHDGLYFFDVFFPGSYPNSPPQVYYYSGGLRINPNLYNSGKVCLSLLGTWAGSQQENWTPGLSTMLQVLVSIQGLILNAKPYFNEPGYADMSGSVAGEQNSLQYNERTFILSMKTMVYSVKRPPKHFEDFVAGHFYNRARDVLLACQGYIEGAQVCCIVKGGVQDVDEGDKGCSHEFRHQLAKFVKTLIDAFKLVGAKDLDQFLPLVHKADSVARPPQCPLPRSKATSNFNYDDLFYQ